MSNSISLARANDASCSAVAASAPKSTSPSPTDSFAAASHWNPVKQGERRAAPRAAISREQLEQERVRVRLRIDSRHAIVTPEGNRSLFYRATKRVFDIVGALAVMILLSPLLAIVTVVLTITTKGRPLFIQQRIGHLGRRFPLIKFRTMRLDADKLQKSVDNEKDGPIFKNRTDPRITRIGRLLRKTSIDEAPQLINVLLGHMAMVGPRPPVEKEVLEYEPWQRRRLSVKPGLTCLWQVSGRSEIGFVDWVRMDLWYVQNQNLKTDLVLLARTPWSVLTCRGAY